MEDVPSVRCTGCGATAPIDLARDDAPCAHCGRRNTVERWRLADAHAWSGRVGERRAREAEARARSQAHAGAARGNRMLLFGTLLFSILFCWWIVAWASPLDESLPLWVDLAIAAATIASMAAMTAGFNRMMVAPHVDLDAARAQAKCTRCGGVVDLQEDQPLSTCPYCGAAGLVPTRAQLRLEREGAARLDRTAEEASRAEAENLRTATEPLGTRHDVRIIVVAIVAAATALTGLIVYAAITASARPATTPTGWTCPVLAVTALVCTAWWIVALRRAIRARRAFDATRSRG